MEEPIQAGGRFHFGSPLNVVISGGFTIIISLAVRLLRDGPDNLRYLDDLVNAVGQSFLATTMRCFRAVCTIGSSTDSEKALRAPISTSTTCSSNAAAACVSTSRQRPGESPPW